jgi:hypothetical protein
MENKHKDRNTLKSYFRKGAVPTEEQFAEMIDSVPNIQEDGQVKRSAGNGLHISPMDANGVLSTIFKENSEEATTPLWRMILGIDGQLEIRDGKDEPVVTIGQDRMVTLLETLKIRQDPTDKDKTKRITEAETLKIEADGLWNDLPVEATAGQKKEGCRVYYITACYLSPFGTYSICETIASHSEGKKRKMHSTRKHWWGWCGHIKIRWKYSDGELRLQMRSRHARIRSGNIYYRIKTLWDL